MGNQFEGFLSDIDRLNDKRAFNAVLEAKDETITDLWEQLSHLYAMREALYGQLRAVDPKNPILVDGSLRKRLCLSAANSFFANPDADGRYNFERAKEVGRTFKIPGR